MNRRRFIGAAALCAATGSRAIAAASPRILDAHVHLFDPTRPGGVPWPEPDDLIYQPALPARLRAIAEPLGVVGAIAIEASPLDADNDWLLTTVERDPFMVGFIGDLVPGSPGFRARLEQLHRSPLFLGVRYGNLWNRDLASDRAKPGFVEDLRALSQAGLVFESANPNPALIAALLALAQQLPELRLVIDHLPHAPRANDAAEERAYREHLQELARSPNVFIKLSEILAPQPGIVQRSSAPYLTQLDPLWEMFGPDRAIFGSDWPNSDHVAPYGQTLAVLRDFVAQRAPDAADRVFRQTSQRAYRWRPRTPAQRAR